MKGFIRRIARIGSFIACIVASCASLHSCVGDIFPDGPGTASVKGVTVGFSLAGNTGGPATRTAINENADGFEWTLGDKVSVWARVPGGNFAFSNQIFKLYKRGLLTTGENGEMAYFTSTLSQEMARGTYSYFLCYPTPETVSGTSVSFKLPSVQDGRASGGVDITLSGETEGSELKAGNGEEDIIPLNAGMKHLLHFFRFYIPQGGNILGEPVEKIVLTMPRNIAGTVNADVTSPSSATLADGVKTVTLELSTPIDATVDMRKYAVAGVFPSGGEYGPDDFMEIELFSATRHSRLEPIALDGRSFDAGHVTGVMLRPESAEDYFEISFRLDGNRIGQDVDKISLTLPSGSVWPGTNSSTYVWDEAGVMRLGDMVTIRTYSRDAYRALSGKAVIAGFESEDALVYQNLTIPDLSGINKTLQILNAPYLFFEDFSGIAGEFHSYDKHATSNPGDKDGYQFLNGWSGARVGGYPGTSIRIGAHRESLATYPARCDSPFLSGLKKNAAGFSSEGKSISLNVTFNYSMNRESGGIGTADVGMELYFGYSTKSGAISSQDSNGSYGGKIYMKEFTGSFTSIENEMTQVLTGMGNDRRISWKTYCEYNIGPNNNTCFLYLDNIRVSIAGNR
ncbi:MAG: hypothetical protein HUJ94_05125 [Bacteroidales bacterium]|nr:hypothetical protein [Bacteroidales bacterium]